ncbi:hypothetical protein R70006_06188 [Paraburkholderia domus]|nr:hypothetical protein R70006_06188 [Paraburkholderia domus]
MNTPNETWVECETIGSVDGERAVCAPTFEQCLALLGVERQADDLPQEEWTYVAFDFRPGLAPSPGIEVARNHPGVVVRCVDNGRAWHAVDTAEVQH